LHQDGKENEWNLNKCPLTESQKWNLGTLRRYQDNDEITNKGKPATNWGRDTYKDKKEGCNNLYVRGKLVND